MKRAITILAAAVALLTSCNKSGEAVEIAADGVAKFSSDISTRVSTDSDGESLWEAGDRVGIYMYDASLSVLRSNVPYLASAGAATTFSIGSGEEAIYYPNSGVVTFKAYSPYTDEEYLTLDVSDQTTVEQRNMLDFMVSNMTSAKSYEDSATAVELEFLHKMAMLKFNVTCNDSVSDLTGLECMIASGLTATMSYDKRTGAADRSTAVDGSINMLVEVAKEKNAATITAIIHPEEVNPSATVMFTLDGAYIATIPATEFVADYIYSFDVVMGEDVPEFTFGTISP